MSDQQDERSWTISGPSRYQREGRRRETPRKNRFVLVVSILVFLCIMLTQILLNFMRSDAFPKLPPGRYAGQFTGLADFSGARDWILTLSDDYKKLEAIFLGSDGAGLPAQRNGSGYLVIEGSEKNLILKGTSLSGLEARGELQIEGARRSGEWTLKPLSIADFSADQSFRHWLQLRAEIDKVNDDLGAAEQLVPAQKTEIEELAHMVTDEVALKDLGQKRSKELQQRLAANETALNKAKADVANGETQLRLAQKVTAKGKLVALARDSLERETRWARSAMAGSLGGNSVDIESAVKKAQEITALKQALEDESVGVQELERELEAKEGRQ